MKHKNIVVTGMVASLFILASCGKYAIQDDSVASSDKEYPAEENVANMPLFDLTVGEYEEKLSNVEYLTLSKQKDSISFDSVNGDYTVDYRSIDSPGNERIGTIYITINNRYPVDDKETMANLTLLLTDTFSLLKIPFDIEKVKDGLIIEDENQMKEFEYSNNILIVSSLYNNTIDFRIVAN